MSIKFRKKYPKVSLSIDLISVFLKYVNEIHHASKNNIKLINSSFKKKYSAKSDEVFFILGSGESINSINAKQWHYISSNRSIALNNWMTHNHIPNFYMMEGLPANRKEYKNYYNSLQSWRDINVKNYLNSNSEVVMLAKDFRKAYFSPDFISLLDGKRGLGIPKFNIPGRTNDSQRRAVEFMEKLRIHKKTFFFTRASITLAISLGYILGFKRIVLCGVDLLNNRYFWQDPNYRKNENIPPPPPAPTRYIHSTVDPISHPVTVDKSVYAINEIFLKKDNVQLNVLNKSSKLYPRIDEFKSFF
jgi:hypothetical protein